MRGKGEGCDGGRGSQIAAFRENERESITLYILVYRFAQCC